MHILYVQDIDLLFMGLVNLQIKVSMFRKYSKYNIISKYNYTYKKYRKLYSLSISKWFYGSVGKSRLLKYGSYI